MIEDTLRLLLQVTEKDQAKVEEGNQKSKFRLFFLEEEDRAVEVKNVDKIDFKYVERRLRKGESVFISHGLNKEKADHPSPLEKDEPWYIHHF